MQGAAWAGLGRTIKMMNLGETPPRPHLTSPAHLTSTAQLRPGQKMSSGRPGEGEGEGWADTGHWDTETQLYNPTSPRDRGSLAGL